MKHFVEGVPEPLLVAMPDLARMIVFEHFKEIFGKNKSKIELGTCHNRIFLINRDVLEPTIEGFRNPSSYQCCSLMKSSFFCVVRERIVEIYRVGMEGFREGFRNPLRDSEGVSRGVLGGGSRWVPEPI